MSEKHEDFDPIESSEETVITEAEEIPEAEYAEEVVEEFEQHRDEEQQLVKAESEHFPQEIERSLVDAELFNKSLVSFGDAISNNLGMLQQYTKQNAQQVKTFQDQMMSFSQQLNDQQDLLENLAQHSGATGKQSRTNPLLMIGLAINTVLVLVILFAVLFSNPMAPTSPANSGNDLEIATIQDEQEQDTQVVSNENAPEGANNALDKENNPEEQVADQQEQQPKQQEPSTPATEDVAQTEKEQQPEQPVQEDKPNRIDLRNALLEATAKKRWTKAVKAGETLQKYYKLSLDEQYALGKAFRKTNREQQALPLFEAFFINNPKDKSADEAMFFAAEIYKNMGQKKQAKKLYRKVARQRKSDYRAAAQKRLKQL